MQGKVALAALGIVLAATLVWLRAAPAGAPLEDPILARVHALPPSAFDEVGRGGLDDPLSRTVGSDPLRGASGKPMILYVGSETCAACAAERWSIAVALSRFGTLRQVDRVRSSSREEFPQTAGLSFRRSVYESSFVDFDPVETADQSGQPLETPTIAQSGSLHRFDPEGRTPYVSVADRLIQVGSGYSPAVLAGLDWDQIAAALADPSSPVARAIIGNANYLTAAICDVTGGAPANVCGSDAVRGLERK